MSEKSIDASNMRGAQNGVSKASGQSLTDALKAIEPEIEQELASLDSALSELQDAATVDRISMAAKRIPPMVARPQPAAQTQAVRQPAPAPVVSLNPKASPTVSTTPAKPAAAARPASAQTAAVADKRQVRTEPPPQAQPTPAAKPAFTIVEPVKAEATPVRPVHEAEAVGPAARAEPVETKRQVEGLVTIDGDNGPIPARPKTVPANGGGGGNDGGGPATKAAFHQRLTPVEFTASLKTAVKTIRHNLAIVMLFTIACNVLVLAIPIYLFQISDRVLTSRSLDTLIMLTIVIVGAIFLQAAFDAVRRMILMRTAVEFAAQLGAPVLSAAARASLHSNGKEYQTLGDLQQVRSFLVSRTLLSFLDAPMAPLFVVAVFLIHPHLGWLVVLTGVILLVVTLLNQRATAKPFGEANTAQVKANLHLDSMSRNSQIINALAMIPEAVGIWGKDTANSLTQQVVAQDRNVLFASISKAARLLTQVAMLGWGAYLAIEGEITGGMVIASSIIGGRALAPIEGAIEGWNQFSQSRAAYNRVANLLTSSPLNFERLKLPKPEGRLDVERLLYVPQGTKRVVLNGVTFALKPGESLAIIGNSGAGKTTLGKMLVGSILPTSGNVRLDLMDLRNWDHRQFGENIGYLPQDVQLFPGTIKANIARMRPDATDAEIYEAAKLADVHEMIANLPHGYETVVASDGSPLSGGQKQRIALARAFFGSPRFVVLDEPNSNLDSAGDMALMRALGHAKKNNITVVTITQRPSLLQQVDKVLLLVNGTVALFGARNEVMQALANRGMPLDAGTGSFGHQQIE